MSTRSQLDFHSKKPSEDLGTDESRVARIYNHWDGYPEQRLMDIKKALNVAKKNWEKEPGFNYRTSEIEDYMGDIAAFYIIANKEGAGNIEIDNNLHSNIRYLYEIWADKKKGVMVRILEPKDGYWDNPKIENMKVFDEGELNELIKKYKEEK